MRVLLSLKTAGLILAILGADAARAQGPLDQLEKKLGQIQPADSPAESVMASQVGYLGLVANDHLGRDSGVIVSRVVADGPAAQAGIQPGDQILSVNGRTVRTLEDMDRLVRKPAGTRLQLEIRRNNTIAMGELTLAVPPGSPAGPPSLDELPPPPSPQMETPPLPAPMDVDANRPSLGVNVVDVTPETRRQYQLIVRSGAIIRTIRDGSAAEAAGLPLGGAVVAIDGQLIKSADELVAAVQAHQVGDVIDVTYYDKDRMARKKVKLGPSSSMLATPAERPGPPLLPVGPAPRAPAPTPPPAGEPALRLGKPNADRSIMRRPGQTLDTLLPPADTGAPNTGAPAATENVADSDVALLRRQVVDLQQQLKQLQQRLDQLEKQLNAKTESRKP